MKRRYDLDWLRVIAFALLMLFHTGMMFSSWDWHVKNLETSTTFDAVMRFLHQWRMPLLFFISGSAVWFAMERLSTGRFLVERQTRLLLPLVFGMLAIIPPQVYVERLYHDQQYDSFLDFYRTVFTTGSYPEGNLSWHHLWYVPYIWAFSMLCFPVFFWLKRKSGRELLARVVKVLERPWVFFLIFVPSALIELGLRPFWPGDYNNLLSDWANFAHKLSFFIAGFVLASSEAIYDVIMAHRRKFLLGGILAIAVLHPLWTSDFHFSQPLRVAYRFLANFHCWMWLLAALGYGRRYLSFNHPALRYANEAVYPFYILHQTVIIILAYQLVYIEWGILPKFIVLCAATFVVTWALYAFVIKPFSPIRVLFGMKWKTSPKTEPVPIIPPKPLIGSTGRMVLRLGLVAILGCLIITGACSRRQSSRLALRLIDAPSLSRNILGVPDRQRVAVYLPRSYCEANRRFPVLYFLPNFNTPLWHYTGGVYQGFRLRQALDAQLASGGSDFIAVVPNAVHMLGSSFYRNSPMTGNWEDFITRDLVQAIDAEFRTLPSPASRLVAGHGIGGLGALELALKHPDVFGSVYAMSPALFDASGLRDSGLASRAKAAEWDRQLENWSGIPESTRHKAFRDFVQTRVNSPSRERFFMGFAVAYAAAVSADISAPFPHVALPADNSERNPLEAGFGSWSTKLAVYANGQVKLKSIAIEYGRNDEYAWLRRGADYVSGLMDALGVQHELAVHDGGHDNTLGHRLKTGLLPTTARVLSQTP